MQRDSRDVWPDSVPIGTFDIVRHGLEGHDGITAHIMFVCPKGRRCGVFMAPQPIPRQKPDDLFVWGWDGNLDSPTLTPSINCLSEKDGKPAGGCGWHGFITAGEIK